MRLEICSYRQRWPNLELAAPPLQANFHCDHFNNPHANGGYRLMTDNDRPFYRLAVQQAEATYKIRAVHPLFFEWAIDPIATVDGWRHQSGASGAQPALEKV